MIGYFLTSTQIEWVKNNIHHFSEKVPFNPGSILVIDNQGVLMRQVTLYIEAESDFDGNIFIVKYDITSTGGTWDDEVSFRPRDIFGQSLLTRERANRVELAKPTTLHDGDRTFEELKQLISRC